MNSGLDWNGISCFLAIVRAGRLSGAAKRLGVDVATVSRRLAHFEAAIQVRLFERTSSGYSLTEHGHRLLETAEAIESSVLRLQAIVGETTNCRRSVRIGAPPEFGDYFLAPRISAFCQKNISRPQLFVSSETYSLANRDVDLSITLERPTEGRLYARKLTDFSVGYYASERYLRLHPSIADSSKLNRHILIDDIPKAAQPATEPDTLSPLSVSRFLSTSFAGRINATLAGAGVCILPDFVAREHAGLTRVATNKLLPIRSFWIVVHADMRDDPHVKMVTDIILAQVRATHSRFFHDRCLSRSETTDLPLEEIISAETGSFSKAAADLAHHGI